jgi:hypothetical protein
MLDFTNQLDVLPSQKMDENGSFNMFQPAK